MGSEIHDNPEQKVFEQESVKDVKIEAKLHISEAVEILQSLYKGIMDSGKEADAEDSDSGKEADAEDSDSGKKADAEDRDFGKESDVEDPTEKNEPDRQSDAVEEVKEKEVKEKEVKEKKGGSYREVKKTSDGKIYEVNHMPPDSVSKLERDDGPAIRMDKEDHRRTASCGNTREARDYRAKQKELIEQGKFREALQMDIDDIHDKFGDKYDDAIGEMMEYVEKLEQEGKING